MAEGGRRTIRQLVIQHIVAFGMLSLALGGGAFLVSRHLVAATIDANMQARFDEIARTTRAGGLPAALAMIERVTMEGGQFGYVLTDANGRPLRSTGGIGLLRPGWGSVTFMDPDDQRVEVGRTLTGIVAGGATLTVLADRDRIDSFDAAAIAFLSLSIGVLLLVALVGSLSMERAVNERLRAFSATAEAIMDGRLNQRVPSTGTHDEFDALSATMNRMLDRLNELFGEVRRITSYVAHDLRTPLARLAGTLRAESRRCTTAESCSSALSRAALECDGLLELVASILQLGQIDQVEVRARGDVIDLSEMLQDLSDAHVAVVEASGRSFTASIQPNARVRGMRDLLAQAFINLIDNAVEHTAPEACVRVALSRVAGHARLTVSDDSPGSPYDPSELLSDDRRSSRSPEHGDRMALGLKLVRSVAVAHEGSFRLEHLDPGLRITIDLPLAAA